MKLNYIPVTAHEEDGNLFISEVILQGEGGFDIFDAGQIDGAGGLGWVGWGGSEGEGVDA